MKYIDNDILEMNVTTHRTASREYSERCTSCAKQFSNGDKKIKWRLRLTSSTILPIYGTICTPYAIWHH